MSVFRVTKGDIGTVLSATLSRNQVSVVNADVDTATFVFSQVDGDRFERAATNTGAGGIFTYTFEAADWVDGQFDVGRYDFEAVLDMVGGAQATYPSHTTKAIEVKRAL